jgi:hypothetical protein
MKTTDRAKAALWARFRELTGIDHDVDGYVSSPEKNLLPDVSVALVRKDFEEGSGQEWSKKIRAIHSSSALAANVFGRWKREPQKLRILGLAGFGPPTLEKKCPTGLQGTPPNLDVFLESATDIVGIESKLLEPLTKKQPRFSTSYVLDKLPRCEKQWWALLESAKHWSPAHFDVGQIIKHYLGLRNQCPDGRRIHLIYLYWRPSNAASLPEYTEHYGEIQEVLRYLHGSEVEFTPLDYIQLWDDWQKGPEMEQHATRLKERYCVEI